MADNSKVEVCIGIPTLNGPERLRRCLKALYRTTQHLFNPTIKILLSDDGSTPQNLEENKRLASFFDVDMLTSSTRLGVPAQWNRLTRHTPATTMIILTDDVEVVPDWFEVLVYSIVSNPQAGMIGLKAFEGVTSEYFTPPKIASYNEAVMERGVGFLAPTGFLFGFDRRKFDELGGFDEQFFAFYEEVDLGLRMLEHGWPSYLLSYPIVLHQGGATTSDSSNIDAARVMAESRTKFMAKHGGIQTKREQLCEPWIERHWPKPKQWNTMLKTWSDR